MNPKPFFSQRITFKFSCQYNWMATVSLDYNCTLLTRWGPGSRGSLAGWRSRPVGYLQPVGPCTRLDQAQLQTIPAWCRLLSTRYNRHSEELTRDCLCWLIRHKDCVGRCNLEFRYHTVHRGVHLFDLVFLVLLVYMWGYTTLKLYRDIVGGFAMQYTWYGTDTEISARYLLCR